MVKQFLVHNILFYGGTGSLRADSLLYRVTGSFKVTVSFASSQFLL